MTHDPPMRMGVRRAGRMTGQMARRQQRSWPGAPPLRACEVFRRARADAPGDADLGAKHSRSSGYGENLQRRAAPLGANERVCGDISQALSACAARWPAGPEPQRQAAAPLGHTRASPRCGSPSRWLLSTAQACPRPGDGRWTRPRCRQPPARALAGREGPHPPMGQAAPARRWSPWVACPVPARPTLHKRPPSQQRASR
jgi:hypothetical protein